MLSILIFCSNTLLIVAVYLLCWIDWILPWSACCSVLLDIRIIAAAVQGRKRFVNRFLANIRNSLLSVALISFWYVCDSRDNLNGLKYLTRNDQFGHGQWANEHVQTCHMPERVNHCLSAVVILHAFTNWGTCTRLNRCYLLSNCL